VLTQDRGARCSPKIDPPSKSPVAFGDIPAGESARASFSVDLTGCEESAHFILTVPWSSATYEKGTLVVPR
jgi:hypothetical protein